MLTKYSHPDGGTYVIASTDPVQMKCDDGRWEPAVIYRRVERGPTGHWQYEGKNHFVTTVTLWNELFTAIEE